MMTWWRLLLHAEALLRRQPAFWLLGLILTATLSIPGDSLPDAWTVVASLATLVLVLWLVPRAMTGIVVETDRVAGGAAPAPWGAVWQASARRAGAVRGGLILLAITWALLAFVLGAAALAALSPILETRSVAGAPGRSFILAAGLILLYLFVALGISLYYLMVQAIVLGDEDPMPAVRAGWWFVRHRAGTTLGVVFLTLTVGSFGEGLSAVVANALPDAVAPLPRALEIGILWLLPALIGAPFAVLPVVIWTLYYREYRPQPAEGPRLPPALSPRAAALLTTARPATGPDRTRGAPDPETGAVPASRTAPRFWCPGCGQPIPPGWTVVCPSCGRALPEAVGLESGRVPPPPAPEAARPTVRRRDTVPLPETRAANLPDGAAVPGPPDAPVSWATDGVWEDRAPGIAAAPATLWEPDGRPAAAPRRRWRRGAIGLAVAVALAMLAVAWFSPGRPVATTTTSLPDNGTCWNQDDTGAETPRVVRVGDTMPDFDVTMGNGASVPIDTYRGGRPLWLNFWDSTCPACRAELPDVQMVSAQYRTADLALLGINVGEDPEVAESYVAQHRYDWLRVFDQDGSITNTYCVSSVPTSVFVDHTGIIRGIVVGRAAAAALQHALTPLLAR